MVNQRQKAPELLANRRGGRGRGLSVVARDEAFKPPKPPPGLHAYTKGLWNEFWTTDVSAAIKTGADRRDIETWARNVDEYHRLWPIVVKAPLIKGATQLVMNPLARRLALLSKDIQWASDHFGMNPLGRFRLQLTVSEAGKSANELLRMLSEGIDERDVIDLDELE
jgi:hypothetical protein